MRGGFWIRSGSGPMVLERTSWLCSLLEHTYSPSVSILHLTLRR